MPRTEAQEKAISARGHDILVSAAAGSGKTSVLVDRIISFVLEGISLQEMLVVTFTNAAAGEMKERLAKGLQKAMEASSNPETAYFLRHELRDLAASNVSTMHTFCGKILRRYHHFLDIEPNFRIITGASHTHMMNEALDRTFESFYQRSEESFFDLLMVYGTAYDDRSLKQIIRELYQTSLSKADPEAWLEHLKDRSEEGLTRAVKDHFQQVLDEIIADMNEAYQGMKMLLDENEELQGYASAVASDAKLIHALLQAQSCSFPDQLKLLNDLANQPFARLGRLGRQLSELTKEDQAVFKTLRDDGLKKAHARLKKLLPKGGFEQILQDHALQAPRTAALVDLTLAFRRAFQEDKSCKNSLDFADLEHEMIRLLKNEDVRQELKKEIKLIFFDEYQDANPVQEAIVEQLANPQGLFFVGDVKQAIYRFRQADPRIFNRRYERYGRDSVEEQVIHLSENFRSHESILTFANQVFQTLMTPRLGEVDYQAKGQALVPGLAKASNDGLEHSRVQWARILFGDLKDERYRAEGLWIAKECRRLVEEEGRRYSDMAVLLRVTNQRLHAYEDAFDELGVPYFSDHRQIEWTHLEVRLFLDFLRVIDNDERDIPLLAVLTSPFIGMNETTLARIRLLYPEDRFSSALQAVLADETAPFHEEIRSFYDRLAEHRLHLRMQGLTDFAQDFFENSGYRAYLESMAEGHERVENVQALIDLMRTFEQDHVSGLYGFLSYVEGLEREGGSALQPGLALGAEDNCVRMMSIHKSKGLGFPIVFLADMAHAMNFRDTTGAMVSHMDLGVAFEIRHPQERWHRPSFEKRVIAHAIESDTRSEEVRLLYVAMTRAKDRLYLVSGSKAGNGDEQGGLMMKQRLAMAGSFAAWMDILMTGGVLGNTLLYQEVAVDELLEGPADSEKRSPDTMERDERLMLKYRNILGFEYPYRQDTDTAFKQTVSEINAAHRLQNTTIRPWPSDQRLFPAVRPDFPRPSFLEAELHFTAAEIGSLLHKALQILPLKSYDDVSLTAALDQLCRRGLFRAEERAALDNSLLLGFFNSALGQRILASANTVEREVSFTMQYDGHIVDGQIDLIYRDEAGYHIVDFKSDREIHPDDYQWQLALYAEALQLARQTPVVSTELYWLRHRCSTRLS